MKLHENIVLPSPPALSKLFRKPIPSFFFCVVAFFLNATIPQHAEGQLSQFSPNIILSDGKDGRVWQQWKQSINNSPISSIVAQVQKVSGGNDTFVNLRFGNDNALENGRQFFVGNGARTTLTWNLNGAIANGKPLVMNAYKGEVRLLYLKINFLRQVSQLPGIGSGIATNQVRPPYNQRPPHAGRPPRPHPHGPNYQGPSYPGHPSHAGHPPHEGHPSYPNKPQDGGGYSQQGIPRACRRGNLRLPRVEVRRVRKTGGLFAGKYRVKGSIFAACVIEAGYYERGSLQQEIEFPLLDRFERRDFHIKARSGRDGAIRVFMANGEEETIFVDDIISQQSGQSLF
jgi:hypothetical protein